MCKMDKMFIALFLGSFIFIKKVIKIQIKFW